MSNSEFEQIFPLGEPNDAYAEYLIGQSYLAPLTDGDTPVSNVSFEPGCRNNWHIHHGSEGGGDQILLCTAGSGWFQAEGEAPVSMEPGTLIRVPAGTKHWQREGRRVVLARRLHHAGQGRAQRVARACYRRGLQRAAEGLTSSSACRVNWRPPQAR